MESEIKICKFLDKFPVVNNQVQTVIVVRPMTKM